MSAGRPISLSSDPLEEIRPRMGDPVRNIYIVSSHGCRTGTSFQVGKNISVVTTSRHQYKTSTPTVVKVTEPIIGDTYSVVEPTMIIGKNIAANPNTIKGVVDSIRGSISPEDDTLQTMDHALLKRTRAVIKMRKNDDIQPMTIPDSRIFVSGKKISGYEGVFLVNREEEKRISIDDVTPQFGLIKREPADRTLNGYTPKPHPQRAVIEKIIGKLKNDIKKIQDLTKGVTTSGDGYIRRKQMDIDMLEIELKNESVMGEYKHAPDPLTGVERDVLFSDIANHATIQDGDVIILHACNGICGERMSFMHGEGDDKRTGIGLRRTRSSSIEQNVLKGIIYRDDTPYSASEEMGGGNSNLKTKKNNATNIKKKKNKRLSGTTIKRRALHRKLRRSRSRSRNRSYLKLYHI